MALIFDFTPFRRVWLGITLLLLSFTSASAQKSEAWFPPGSGTVRGMYILFTETSEFGKPPNGHWEEALTIWNFAHVRMARDQSRSRTALLAELKNLADKSGHPELEHAPILTSGFSWNSGHSYGLVASLPERVIAAAIISIGIGGTPADAESQLLKTPIVFMVGEGDNLEETIDPAFRARRLGAHWSATVQTNVFHNFSNLRSQQFVVPFFDECIRYRLPPDQSPLKAPVKLRNFEEKEGWLGIRDEYFKSDRATIVPVAEYHGAGNNTIWFPTEALARHWRGHMASYITLMDRPFNSSPLEILGGASPYMSNQGSAITAIANYTGTIPIAEYQLFAGSLRVPENMVQSLVGRVSDPAPGYHMMTPWARLSDGRWIGGRSVALGVRRGSIELRLIAREMKNSLRQGEAITLEAYPLASKGQVSEVEFFAGSKSLGKRTSAPFSMSWNAEGEGTVGLFAVARASQGDSARSMPVPVSVLAPPRPGRVRIHPELGWVAPGGEMEFTAALLDQYGRIMTAPSAFVWNASGGGTVSVGQEPGRVRFRAGDSAGGPYTLAASVGGATGKVPVRVTQTMRVNFQPVKANSSGLGFIEDIGQPYGQRSSGRSFGWLINAKPGSPRHILQRPNRVQHGIEYTTFISMHMMTQPPYNKTYYSATWEMEVPNGVYSVRLVAGDAENINLELPFTLPRVEPDKHKYRIAVEDQIVVEGSPTREKPWVMGEADVTVSDGKLTVSNAPGQFWNKLCFLEFAPKGALAPVALASPVATNRLNPSQPLPGRNALGRQVPAAPERPGLPVRFNRQRPQNR